MSNKTIAAILGLIGAFALLVSAQDAEPPPIEQPSPMETAAPSPPPASSGAEMEVLEFKRGQVHDVQFHASIGRIIFKVGDIEYDWSPSLDEKNPSSIADEISASAAVLAEFRHADRIRIKVPMKPDKPKHYFVSRMIFLFDNLK
jgi:hypothetical protein